MIRRNGGLFLAALIAPLAVRAQVTALRVGNLIDPETDERGPTKSAIAVTVGL